MKTLLQLSLSIVALLACVSCTVKPFTVTTGETTTAPQKTYRSLGGSILTKAKTEMASMTLPDGTSMSYYVTGKNEVSVPNAYIAGQVAESLSAIAADVSKAGTAAEVSKASIDADKVIKVTESNNALEAAKLVPVE